jgi:GT2 family glycosyltransferase
VEVIVVDNASTDNTPEEITVKYPRVNFIFNQSNIGFSAACNHGFAISKGDVLLFLNPDAKLIDSNLRKAIAEASKNYPAILGAQILNPDNSVQDSLIEIPTATSVFREAFFLSYFQGADQKKILSEKKLALSGACLLMYRSVFEQLDGFDESLFWMDDVDLCFRARQKGMKLIYFPEWKIIHKIGVSSRKNYKKVISNQLISKLKFFRKNKLRGDYVLSLIATKLHILLRILLFIPLLPFKKEFRLKFVAYCYSLTAFYSYIFTGNNRIY